VTDELSTPLGQTPKKSPRGLVVPKAVPAGIALILGAALLGFIGWAVIVDDPLGGEPVATISLNPRAADTAKPGGEAAGPNRDQAPSGPAPSITSGEAVPKTSPAGTATVTIIDGVSGKREQVTIPAAQEPGKPAADAKAPLDARLAEASKHGAIPKIGADGTRASEIFASPLAAAAARATGPRVAIVVGRLGVGASMTTEALTKLPAPVAVAFTPYGTDVSRWAARARGEGREVLLQVPMEPFDYPDNDSGPQTLTVSLPADQNMDRLHWAMSRFQGYVGVMNYMGARFLTNEPGVSAVVREAGARGLIYFDDGSATRSLAGQIAGVNNVPFARADVVIDAVQTPSDIDAALARLETLARERGIAVGSANATPVSIERIGRWAKAAGARGVTLVPLSAVTNKPKSS
jgi:polysaccharide deacetylase 2 family uncharacterized protein YibQ